jgi:hypothetical protein
VGWILDFTATSSILSRWFCPVFLLLCAISSLALPVAAATRIDRLPSVYLWAWDRAENLKFLNSADIGVAFLAQRIILGRKGLKRIPRLHQLQVNPAASLIATTRIEIERNCDEKTLGDCIPILAAAIAKSGNLPHVQAVQIDFDALKSERTFYRHLLEAVRKRLPDGMPLSITALASWCLGDHWIFDLPLDEAVAMMFQVGRERHNIMVDFASRTTEPFNSSGSYRQGVAFSTSEPDLQESTLAALRRSNVAAARIYLFNPHSWTEATAHEALRRLRE